MIALEVRSDVADRKAELVLTRRGRTLYDQVLHLRLAMLAANDGQIGDTWYGSAGWNANAHGIAMLTVLKAGAGYTRKPRFYDREFWKR